MLLRLGNIPGSINLLSISIFSSLKLIPLVWSAIIVSYSPVVAISSLFISLEDMVKACVTSGSANLTCFGLRGGFSELSSLEASSFAVLVAMLTGSRVETRLPSP